MDTVDGITIESRPVDGSSFVELRFTTTAAASPERLCAAAFGTGRLDPEETDVKSRKVISESEDERVTYDQVSAAVVSDRDYAVRARRERLEGGACRVRFEAVNELAPPLPHGFVRITKLKATWLFEPLEGGQSRITYVIFSDPAGSVPAFLVEGTRREVGVRWVKMISRRAAAGRRRPPVSSPALVLSCAGLKKRFADVQAVAQVDLELKRGECFGLLGPNGAGKTTTIEILEGLTEADGGEVRILGLPLGDPKVRERVGIALQETQLPDKLTVEECVRLFRSFYAKGRGVDEVIAHLELGEKRTARVAKLSGGQRQRLALACALVGDPELLFLDEPTTGLDPQARLKVWEIVLAFKAQGGTLLLTTHYMEEAARLCDRLAILDHGKVIARGTPQQLVDSLGAGQVLEVVTSPALDDAALTGLPSVVRVAAKGDARVLHVTDVTAALPALLELARGRGLPVKHIVTREATLEDVFVHLTGAELRDE